MLLSCMHTWFQYLQNSICYFLHKEFDEFQIENVIFSITFLKIKNIIDQILLYPNLFLNIESIVEFVKFESSVEIKRKENLMNIHFKRNYFQFFSVGLAIMTFVKTTPFGVVLQTVELIPMKFPMNSKPAQELCIHM